MDGVPHKGHISSKNAKINAVAIIVSCSNGRKGDKIGNFCIILNPIVLYASFDFTVNTTSSIIDSVT